MKADLVPALVCLLRRLQRHPGWFFLPATLISLGLAATLVVYAILDHVFWKPLPFPQSERLVSIYSTPRTNVSRVPVDFNALPRDAVSKAIWKDVRANDSFEEVGVWFRRRAFIGFPADDIIERWYASSDFFRILGTEMATGRMFNEEEESTKTNVALLSWECWQRRYGGRADILDMTVTLADAYFAGAPPEAKRIVGVLKPGFQFRGAPPEVILPVGEIYGGGSFQLVGRLAEGTTYAAATVAVTAVLATHLPNVSALVIPLRDDLGMNIAPPVWLLVGIAGTLLLVTATAVAGLLINARLRRGQEHAIRQSLGASPRSLRIEVALEYFLMSAVAVAAAIALSHILLRLLTVWTPTEFLAGIPAGVDHRVAFWGGGIALIVTSLCGFIATATPTTTSNLATRASSNDQPHFRLHRLVATCQLALSFVLFVAAVLLGQTFYNLASRPTGFEVQNVAILSYRTTVFPRPKQNLGAQDPMLGSWAHTEGLLETINAIPGVVRSAAVSAAPFSGVAAPVRVQWQETGTPIEFDVQTYNVTTEYWSTLGIPLLSGRFLGTLDRRFSDGQKIRRVVVSQEVERLIGRAAVGRRLVVPESGESLDIVGVVGNIKQRSLREPETPKLYLLSSAFDEVRSLLIRTSVPADGLLLGLRRRVIEHDPTILVTQATTIGQLIAESVWTERFRASLGALLGLLTMVLAGFGTFLLGLRLVETRRREIGIRFALGATSGDIRRMIWRDAVRIGFASLALGIPVAWAVASGLKGLLFGVSATDVTAFVMAGAGNFVAVSLALISPIRLALAIDPARVLRE